MTIYDTKAKVPAKETLWQQIETGNKLYIVTSNPNRDKYHLYAVQNGKLSKRIGTAADPVSLKKKFIKK